MKINLRTKNGNIQVEEPEINKMYEELTRLTLLSNYWKNIQQKTLMRICLKARNRKKLIFGHDIKSENQSINMFFTDNTNNNFSIFITGVSVLIDDKEVSASEAYIKLIRAGICNYKRNNVFDVVRDGNIFSKQYNYRIKKGN